MDGDHLMDIAEALQDRGGFLRFLEALYENHRQFPDEWENDDLESFLDGLLGFARDTGGYYSSIGCDEIDLQRPTWRAFAEMLLAAKVYE